MTALQTLVSRRIFATDSAVVTVGSFHAGTAGNIIAGEAELKGIIRTLGPEMREKMCRMVKETAEGGLAVTPTGKKLCENVFG